MSKFFKGGRLLGAFSLLFACFFIPSDVHAETISEMFINFEQSYPALRALIGRAFQLIGVCLVAGSLLAFIRHNEGKGEIKTAIGMFFIGVALFQVNGMVNSLTSTLYTGVGSTDIFSYSVGGMSSSAAFGGAMSGVLGFIQIIGYIAFGRGWLLINQYTSRPQGGDGLGRGITHLLGGVMAINVKVTVMMLVSTFAPNMTGTISNFIGG